MLGPRLLSTVILVALIGLMVWRQWVAGIFLTVAVLSLLALWEFYASQEAKGLKVFKKAGMFAGVAFYAVLYLDLAGVRPVAGSWDAIQSLIVLLVILGIFTRQVFEKSQATPVATVSLTLFGFFYIAYLSQYMPKIIYEGGGDWRGIVLILYLAVLTKITDAGAYVIGSLIGHHKMIPRISPGKSWEGFAGGILVSLGMSLLLVRLFPTSLGFLEGIHAWILGLLIPLVSVVGDLVESIIKRDARIKDSGAIIPGIGGCLDLVDSLLFTAPVFYFYMILVTGL